MVVTQKAKGLCALRNAGLPVPAFKVFTGPDNLPESFEQLLYEVGCCSNRLFARPCPLRPVHGGVESRVVKSFPEILAIFEEMRTRGTAENPYAELILQAVIPAKWNIVWTPTRIACGPGNDGATSGCDTIDIPLVEPSSIELPVLQAGILADEAPYLEVVYPDTPTLYPVQLRGGPRLGTTRDFIPDEVTVANIIEATGDLIDFAIELANVPPGTVVDHSGGSLASHYGVHCVAKRVPILTTRTPHMGEVLSPTGPLAEPDPKELLRGIANACTLDYPSLAVNYVEAALFLVHNSAALAEHAALLGWGIGTLLRFGAVAAASESRYCLPWLGWEKSPVVVTGDKLRLFLSSSGIRATGCIEHLPQFQQALIDLQAGSSVAGPTWGQCVGSAMAVQRAIASLATGTGNTSNVIVAVNVMVNMAHNGGWWFNKWAGKAEFNAIADGEWHSSCIAAIALHGIDKQLVNPPLPDVFRAPLLSALWRETPTMPSRTTPLLPVKNTAKSWDFPIVVHSTGDQSEDGLVLDKPATSRYAKTTVSMQTWLDVVHEIYASMPLFFYDNILPEFPSRQGPVITILSHAWNGSWSSAFDALASSREMIPPIPAGVRGAMVAHLVTDWAVLTDEERKARLPVLLTFFLCCGAKMPIRVMKPLIPDPGHMIHW